MFCLKSGKVLSIVLLWRTLLLKHEYKSPFICSGLVDLVVVSIVSYLWAKIQSMSYKEMLIVWITREETHMQNGYSLYFPLMKYFYQLLIEINFVICLGLMIYSIFRIQKNNKYFYFVFVWSSFICFMLLYREWFILPLGTTYFRKSIWCFFLSPGIWPQKSVHCLNLF